MKNLGIRSIPSCCSVGVGPGRLALAQQPGAASPSSAPVAAASPAAAVNVSASAAPGNVVAPVNAASPAATPAAAGKPDPRAELVKKIPGTKPDDFRQSPIPGLWEARAWLRRRLRHRRRQGALAGDLYEIATDTNISERRRRDVRLELIKSVPESQMVVFSPKDPKYTITVFTDIDCGYFAAALQRDRQVQRARHPHPLSVLSAFRSEHRVLDKAVAVWCARRNRNDALTRAKRGESIKMAKRRDTGRPRLRALPGNRPARHAGDRARQRRHAAGYVPPAMLAKRLQSVGR